MREKLREGRALESRGRQKQRLHHPRAHHGSRPLRKIQVAGNFYLAKTHRFQATISLMSLNLPALARAADESRGLSIDAVCACQSGHLGLPLGAAEIGAVLFGASLSFHPGQPEWLNRDRFVLSAGHGSMFLYSWLHLAGYAVTINDLKAFRKLHSITPGHPEFGETPGVEATTGPLGQGTGNVVGMAVAAKMAAAKFNTADHVIFDHHVVALAGDGCLQEGISHEAASFAGRFGLDNLIMLYDSNDITLDAMADKTQSEDTALRYEAYQWDVVTLPDGHDLKAIFEAIEAAKENDNGRPKLIICKTEAGRGISEVAGTAKAHGEGGAKYATAARKSLGLPEELFYVSPETRTFFAERAAALAEQHARWEATFTAWQAANPELAKVLAAGQNKEWGTAEELLAHLPEASTKPAATRATGGAALDALAKAVPLLLSGSADLHGSTKNYLSGQGDFDTATPTGRNFYFGIREHAMGAIVNGIGYYGIFKASGATFLTFSDYMRPAVRLAALAKLPIFHVWTHDSVGVGEDGPTHQPVETVSALRCIPGLVVLRPADAEEAAAAVAYAVAKADGPVGLILSRQNVPNLSTIPASTRRLGTLNGAYIARLETAALHTILIATGSEVSLALEAAAQLGDGCRVVSMPSMELFEAQPAAYREAVLPSTCRRRVSIEAGVSQAWGRYVGLDGKTVATDRFGLSAPGDIALTECGISVEHILAAARSL